MDYTSTVSTTWPESAFEPIAPPSTNDSVPAAQRAPRGWKKRRGGVATDSSAFGVAAPQPTQATVSAEALPGEALTPAVSANIDERRTLQGVFRTFARYGAIGQGTLASLERFLDALPRAKHLPTVAPDGEGGLTLAWAVPGHGRTLVTVEDSTLYVVANAGTHGAHYLPDLDFAGALSDELLALIPG